MSEVLNSNGALSVSSDKSGGNTAATVATTLTSSAAVAAAPAASAAADPAAALAVVYVPMAADLVHAGHVNIITKAAALGRVVVGLFTDEAIASYKHQPLMSYEERKAVVSALKGVSLVIPQVSKDYSENLIKLKPAFMVHGTDWRQGALAEVRAKAIELMSSWGGQVVEPEYTQGISSSELRRRLTERVKKERGA